MHILSHTPLGQPVDDLDGAKMASQACCQNTQGILHTPPHTAVYVEAVFQGNDVKELLRLASSDVYASRLYILIRFRCRNGGTWRAVWEAIDCIVCRDGLRMYRVANNRKEQRCVWNTGTGKRWRLFGCA